MKSTSQGLRRSDPGGCVEGGAYETLYHIAGSPHADTLLMAYFPRERILVEADVYNPGAAVTPFASSLLESITKRNLRVDRIVPLHAAIAPYSELVKTVRTATN